MKQFVPFLVNINNKNILIIGGGKAALLKAKGIYRFTSRVTILAPHITNELMEYPFRFIRREYKAGTVDDFFMVYACTDNAEINKEIGIECQRKNILYSVCDNPDMSSFVTPAIYKNDDVTISVGTNGNNPLKAIFIRNQIQQLIENNILKIENIIE
ncbi:bifunctional precorrin-2 dehydrogenase/sirohydrochlorin ferrochelatase [Dysgonomonas sp. Marseille-P4677]|uniref:precorrin-2 dehydrogenase/sirohydrochlorin ferrochelatase family protein n=1 Tax=Dysgonomonas sp. Marseille-P4677 TaxID=2364790 RepID=UPI00191293B1|nr:bifunctional precorrin-2 dehydrogenase/sirohydrochlorin ferrochelatase [Dysgonomonas sp. Marseille-P4677]MBK5720645.1 bifunctional precorrin-2 dehydrogenase/sirohydrochlorin ferrochelatase [Dysgonomonas sp. Marseille-P4677]